jgi:membrane protease YdiL (CAAX protease family)
MAATLHFVRQLRPRRPFRFWPTLGTIVAALLILTFSSNLIVPFFSGPAVADESSAFSNMVDAYSYLAMVAFLVWCLPRLAQATWRDIGFCRPCASDIALVCGSVVFSKIFLTGIFAVYLAAIGQTDHVQAGFEDYHIRTPLEHLTAFACMSVADPLGEELLFRAVLLAAIARRFGVRAGVIGSGLIFGAVHMDPVFFPMLALDGILWGALYVKTRNIIVPMVGHGLSNAMFALF